MLLPETLKLHDQERFNFHYIYFLPWKHQMVGPIKEAGGKVTCIEANNNLQMLLKFRKVSTYCKENDIDVIHAHLPWSGFLGRLVHSRFDAPMIYTEHNIQERYHPATKKLNKLTFNQQDLALGVSEDVTTSIKENIRPKIPVRTLLNGVNTARFKRNPERGLQIKRKHSIPDGAPVIGNIAVFREQKGLLDWVQAFDKIHKQNPQVYGLLVGAGPEEEELRNLIGILGLEERIRLPGLQTNTIGYFSAMDIFMMSSLFEGLPIALLEAMSMNCAIVSTRAGGVTEAVRDNEDGLLCEIGDWEKLAQSTSFLVSNEEERKKFQERSRKRVVENFSLSGMVETLEEIYLNIKK